MGLGTQRLCYDPEGDRRPWPVQVHRPLLAALQVGWANTAGCALCTDRMRGLHWANVYSSLDGTSCTVITGYLGIKDLVVLL